MYFSVQFSKIKPQSNTRQEAERCVLLAGSQLKCTLHTVTMTGSVARSPADVTGEQWPVLVIELSHCNLQSVGDATHCIAIASLDLETRVREVFLCPDCLGPSFF